MICLKNDYIYSFFWMKIKINHLWFLWSCIGCIFGFPVLDVSIFSQPAPSTTLRAWRTAPTSEVQSGEWVHGLPRGGGLKSPQEVMFFVRPLFDTGAMLGCRMFNWPFLQNWIFWVWFPWGKNLEDQVKQVFWRIVFPYTEGESNLKKTCHLINSWSGDCSSWISCW